MSKIYYENEKFNVLELDETRIDFKVDSISNNESSGILDYRTELFDFIKQVSYYYEVVIFNCTTEDYANYIIEEIE